MRPLWKGLISFGLVSIPVKLYLATKSKSISFTLLHKDCSSPIHYRKYCNYCKREIPQEEVVKGFEFSPKKYVIFSEKELEEIPKLKSRQIKITEFTSNNIMI